MSRVVFETLYHKFLSFDPFPNKPLFYLSAVQAFWKHCGKRRNFSSREISPFLTVFSTLFDYFSPILSNLKLLSANFFGLDESKICHLERVNDQEEEGFWKHCKKKENILVNSILSFFCSVFYAKVIIWASLNLSSANAFSLVISKILFVC